MGWTPNLAVAGPPGGTPPVYESFILALAKDCHFKSKTTPTGKSFRSVLDKTIALNLTVYKR